MRARTFSLFWIGLLGAIAAEPDAKRPHPLTWDAMEKSVDAKPGETSATFKFTATNSSDQPVEIVNVQPSCGCTVAETPPKPWVIAPGEKSSFSAVVEFAGKHGKFIKTIYVHTPARSQSLRVTVNIPDSPEAARERNRQLASLDRQAIFRGECASCHAAPTVGKMGAELFQAACAICHQSEHRASMVPDLKIAREARDAAYWLRWITEGKEGSLMPGFARRHQGPLSDAQITSLVEYLVAHFPTEPRTN
jgi:mono/diheme cytochrome c family protein